jgi:hypothetical protein
MTSVITASLHGERGLVAPPMGDGHANASNGTRISAPDSAKRTILHD